MANEASAQHGMLQEARAWVEVDLQALRENFLTIRRTVGDATAIIPMVKADGYGMGAERVVRALDPLEPWGYGVAAPLEGVALRSLGVTRPIIVCSPLPRDTVDIAARAGLTASISDVGGLEQWAEAARRLGAPLDLQVEVDTGMGRSGFDWRETQVWAQEVHARTGAALRWTGVFTHFHSADAADRSPSATQWERFQDALAQLPVSREDLMVHAANSAAAVRWPEYAADAVRPGIFLYGGHPAPGMSKDVVAPLPVASIRARIVLIRDVPPGSSAGYGATHHAQRWSRWGSLAIGYGDGLPRALGNVGRAVVRGRHVPIIGRISMDLTVVDLTDVPEAETNDIATLIGEEGGARVSLEEVASQSGTISYEVLTGLTPRLERVERA